MAILNQPFPVLNTSVSSDVVLQDSTIVWRMREFNDRDYWYVEYKFSDSFKTFPLSCYVPDNTIIDIRNGKVFLMLVNFHETFLDSIEAIYAEIVIKHQIPPEHIVLCSGSMDCITEVRRVAQLHNVPELKVEWFLELEWAVQEQKLFQMQTPNSTYETLAHKDYPKKYLNLNRRWRLHRPTMVALLRIFNVLDKGYVSLGESDDMNTWERMYWWVKSHNNRGELHQLLCDNEQMVFDIPPMYVDTLDLKTNRARLESSIDEFYQNTYFSLVSETNYYSGSEFDSRGRFLTEKTFKTIAQEHPFILITVANSLPLLKQLGYKTFHPYIDESYDSETDDQLRLLMIAKETQRLCNLSGKELETFLTECRKITAHNLNTLLNKRVYTYKVNY
jgi:hypothetical protein